MKILRAAVLIPFLMAFCVSFAVAEETVVSSVVKDDGHFFSAETVESANAKIHKIEAATGLKIHVLTLAELPAGDVDEVAKMSADARSKYFQGLIAQKLATEKGAGIFFLACQKPSHLRVEPFGGLHARGYSKEDSETIEKLCLKGFRSHEYDKTLESFVSRLETIFAHLKPHASNGHSQPGDSQKGHASSTSTHEQHRHVNPLPVGTHQAPSGGGMGSLIVLGIVVVGVIFLIRMLSGSAGGGGVPGMGGGGMMGGLMTGLLGAVAGNWIYNNFFGNSAHANDDRYDRNDRSNEDSANDSSDNTSDADYGGGGDFGGFQGF